MYGFDPVGRTLSVTDANGGISRSFFNLAGEEEQSRDANVVPARFLNGVGMAGNSSSRKS